MTAPRTPPDTARDNGAIEAGIGPLKTRAYEEAARGGRPGAWTCEDVEAARLQADLFAQPHGESGPSAEEAWAAREAISDAKRAAFREALKQEIVGRERAGYDGVEEGVATGAGGEAARGSRRRAGGARVSPLQGEANSRTDSAPDSDMNYR